MSADLEAVIRAVREGDIDAYAGIVRRHQEELWRIAAFALRDATDTEDLVQRVFVRAYTADVFHLVSLREFVRPGENAVSLSADGKGNLACQVVATHYLPWPRETPARDEALSIEQQYNTTRLKKDDILSCRVTLRYNRPEPANMTIVDLGLPPGFEVQADGFQALKDRGVIEQYSVTGRQVILYFRELPAGKPVSFEYRLRAKYPVKAKAPGASAYQYYEPAVRSSTSPFEITVL